MRQPEILDLNGQSRTWDWLTDRYGRIVYLYTTQLPKFQVKRIRITKDKPVISVHVLDEDGSPIPGQDVVLYWPDPDLSRVSYATTWRDRGVVQKTGENGTTEFGLGRGSFIHDLSEGGPHVVWVGDGSTSSDGLAGIGMLGGTHYEGPLDITFRKVTTEPQDPTWAIYGEVLAIRRLLERIVDAIR